METYLELGKTPGIQIDLSEAFYVKFLAKETNKSVLSCTKDLLKDIDKINISLSGGLDSQFSLALAKELKKDITAYTYRSIWNGTICNAEDVYMAQHVSDINNIPLKIIDIDLSNFFTRNLHFNYGKQYANFSPQLAVHLHWLDILKSDYGVDNILMGGDPPLFKYDSENKEHKMRMSDNFYHDILSPYYLFCNKNNITCLRDIYYHSPELVYAGFKNNIDVVKKEKIYIENDGRNVKIDDNKLYRSRSPYRTDNYLFKYAWYNNIIEGLIPQKSETTGFESLKKILASESGVYNQFDMLYRFPMHDRAPKTVGMMLKNRKSIVGKGKRGRNIIMPDILYNLYKDYKKEIIKTEANPVNRYKFDF